MINNEKPILQRALIVAVQLDGVSDVEFESSIAELAELAKTLGLEVVGQFAQKRSAFEPFAYLGVGKRDEIKQFLKSEEENDAKAGRETVQFVLVDHEISPTQSLNLENDLE